MQLGEHRFAAGPVTLALQYRALMADQGVCLQVAGQIDGRERELLRFDCFVERPHYHYDPEGRNERWELDTTTCGHPLRWALTQLRTRLPAMLHKAGYAALAQQLDLAALAQRLPEVEAAAWQLARREHRTVIHNRGEVVIEAGNIRFGLEFRQLRNDRGVAIHVLGDVAGQEIELLAFDCFEVGPHYHYGPRNQDIRIYWDTAVVPDPLRWTLDQFKAGKLRAMLTRAGYPTHAALLDEELVVAKVTQEVEPRALALRAAHAA
ncbi:MAG: hypothetical protein KatS3mg131_3997 [Candidatus Tectimicrobiota bacterium]|nr:MAG: hypothetical protein KatS3mg131_3997 [Candidatus Tectomicrobia bacterium]